MSQRSSTAHLSHTPLAPVRLETAVTTTDPAGIAASAQQRAEQLAAEADRLEAAASAGYGRFDRGQPILVGHHSARSALRDRERADNLTRRAIAAREEARRAQAAANFARDQAHVAAVRAQQSRPWTRADFQRGDTVEVRVGRRTEKYLVVRANAKTLTCRNAFTIDDTKKAGFDSVSWPRLSVSGGPTSVGGKVL
jgi:hypothetical protein